MNLPLELHSCLENNSLMVSVQNTAANIHVIDRSPLSWWCYVNWWLINFFEVTGLGKRSGFGTKHYSSHQTWWVRSNSQNVPQILNESNLITCSFILWVKLFSLLKMPVFTFWTGSQMVWKQGKRDRRCPLWMSITEQRRWLTTQTVCYLQWSLKIPSQVSGDLYRSHGRIRLGLKVVSP